MNIKPIETLYKGYRFRSRTEARWAVFFDALGIEWEYEKEGYDLGELGWYLPDFWLPEWACFAEVKGSKFSQEEFEKAAALPFPCLILDGTPEPRLYALATNEEPCEVRYYEYSIQADDKWSWVDLQWSKYKKRLWYNYGEFDLALGSYDDLLAACAAARSARFEHGESPQIG